MFGRKEIIYLVFILKLFYQVMRTPLFQIIGIVHMH